MGIAFGLFVAALGAIVRYGINADLDGVNLDVIGTILMLVGGAIALISLIFWGLDALAYEDERAVRHRRRRQDRDAALADAELDRVERRPTVVERVVEDDGPRRDFD